MLTIKEEMEILRDQLQGNIRLVPSGTHYAGSDNSKVFVIQDSVAIQFKCLRNPDNKDVCCTTVLLSFYKLNKEDKTSYRLKLSSKELNIDDEIFTTVNKGSWHMIYEKNEVLRCFNVNAIVDIKEYQKTTPILSSIHDDTELTDFELEAVDGSVRVHRLVAGAASPVLRRMLSGEWREVASGRVQLPDTTRETLQHFKDFVYLGALPESGLRPLLLLAHYLMMPALEDRCVLALADGLTPAPDTTYDLIEFAITNRLTKLVIKIMERMEWGKVKMADIKVPSKTS